MSAIVLLDNKTAQQFDSNDFCFMSLQVVPLKNKMTRPAQYGSVCGVVNAATIPDIFLYIIIGVFGYLAYGENTQNPITLNMPQTGM